MSKCIAVYVVHSETDIYVRYSISIKFIAVVFEVAMFRELKLSRISS